VKLTISGEKCFQPIIIIYAPFESPYLVGSKYAVLDNVWIFLMSITFSNAHS
jgi:hypothetical protein